MKAAYFDELAEDGEVTPDRPWDVHLQMWEDLESQKARCYDSAHTIDQLGTLKQSKPSTKRTRRGDDLLQKVCLADGRTTYHL